VPNWILDYVRAVDAVSESPLSYNLWGGISVVSSALKRNVFMNLKTFTIYPNQFIVFVGPPGLGKGVAMRDSHEFTERDKLVNYMSDRVTAPRIIEKLFQGFTSPMKVSNGQVGIGAKDASVTLTSTELPTLIGSSDWMLTFLCDAWDKGKFDYDTKNKGSFVVSGMCVSLIGGCTPDFIRKISKDSNSTVSSGFSARTIFVNETKKSKKLAWADGLRNNPLKIGVIKDLEDRLLDISNLSGEFVLDPYARQLYEKFYDVLDSTDDDTDVYRNFRSRQHIHVLKTAMALSAAESNSLIITKVILEKAIGLVEDIAVGIDEVFRGVGESDLSSALARLQLYIERKKLVTSPQLIEDNIRFINHEDIIKVLNVMELIGFVYIKNQGGKSQQIEWTGKAVNPNAIGHKKTRI
jgi:hypothetical protein